MNRRRIVVALLAVASAVFLAVEISDSWDELDGAQLPGAGWFVLAIGVLAVGQVVIGEAMAALPADPTSSSDRRSAFHLTQPAKYVPAGIAQAAGVVVVLVGRGASRPGALAVWVVHTGSLVVAGLTVGLVAAPALGWSPVVVVPGILVVAVISRPVLGPLFTRVGRAFDVALDVPSTPALARCLTAAVVGVTLHGLGFAVLVHGASLDVGVVEAVAAYTLAFGVSVATPLPGGLGAREAIIVGVLAGTQATLIVPVGLVRLILIGVEVLLLVAVRARTRSRT